MKNISLKVLTFHFKYNKMTSKFEKGDEKMFQISLTAARVNAKLTIDEVAKKMHKSKHTIIAWEKGKTAMDVCNFEKLCILYNIPKEHIILPFRST